MHYCSCAAPNPTPSDTCSCENGGPEPATPSPTAPATPAPTSAATPPATPPATPQATPKPTAPPPPAACLAKNQPCSPTTPCCGSCNTKNGRCSGNGRLLRGRNDDGDQEHRVLGGLFSPSRHRQPVSPSESGREKKVVGKQLLLAFDTEGNVDNVNRRELHMDLDDAQRKWAKNKPKSGYSFVSYTVGGEFAASAQTRPVTITVQDGKPALMTYAQTGETVPADARTNIPPSIEAMLDRIHKDIDSNVASFEVQYYDNGVPRKVCETKILPSLRTELDCMHIINVKAL